MAALMCAASSVISSSSVDSSRIGVGVIVTGYWFMVGPLRPC